MIGPELGDQAGAGVPRVEQLADECARCEAPLGGWVYVLEYCQGQEWYPVDPVCKPCKDEMLLMFGSHYLRWTRWTSSDYRQLFGG